MLSILKKLIPEQYKIKLKEKLGVPSLLWSLQNLKNCGFSPKLAIDAGAYEGEWTYKFKKVFPDAEVLMIEAQASKSAILQSVCNKIRNVHFAICLLSSEDGRQVSFIENETISHVETENISQGVLKLTCTMDKLIEQRGLAYPDLIKLDVQGHEIEVLKGAQKILQHAEVCLLEVTLLNIGDNSPLLAEVIEFMDKHNFQAFDICQFMRRPFDNALYQLDMFFAKKTSHIITTKNWS